VTAIDAARALLSDASPELRRAVENTPNMNGLDFAYTINNMDDHLPKSRGQCFDFGSWYGCKPNCPVYVRGACELQEENRAKFEADEIADDPARELIETKSETKERGNE